MMLTSSPFILPVGSMILRILSCIFRFGFAYSSKYFGLLCMGYRDVQQARRALHAVATTQGGYFTAKQASEAGYGNRHLDYHAKAGNFERVGRGLYRLPLIPPG